MNVSVALMDEDGDLVRTEVDCGMLRPYRITFVHHTGPEVTVLLDYELTVQLWESLKYELSKPMVLDPKRGVLGG